jgi:hypothetical protein
MSRTDLRPGGRTVEIMRGDPFWVEFEIRNEDGSYASLGGSTFRAAIRRPFDEAALVEPTVTVTLSTATVTATGPTDDLAAGSYPFDVVWTDTASVPTTIDRGVLIVTERATL